MHLNEDSMKTSRFLHTAVKPIYVIQKAYYVSNNILIQKYKRSLKNLCLALGSYTT